MLDIAGDLHRWVGRGHDFAVATIVSVSGSAPREPGPALAVNDQGTAVGSVSGGCVEGAVYELCRQALQDGRTVLERFGCSDETAFAAGLTCGGTLHILVTPVRDGEPAREVLVSVLSAVRSGRTIALVRTVRGPAELMGRQLVVRPDGTYEGVLDHRAQLTRIAAAGARAMIEAGRTGILVVGETGPTGLSRSPCWSSPAPHRRA